MKWDLKKKKKTLSSRIDMLNHKWYFSYRLLKFNSSSRPSDWSCLMLVNYCPFSGTDTTDLAYSHRSRHLKFLDPGTLSSSNILWFIGCPSSQGRSEQTLPLGSPCHVSPWGKLKVQRNIFTQQVTATLRSQASKFLTTRFILLNK